MSWSCCRRDGFGPGELRHQRLGASRHLRPGAEPHPFEDGSALHDPAAGSKDNVSAASAALGKAESDSSVAVRRHPAPRTSSRAARQERRTCARSAGVRDRRHHRRRELRRDRELVAVEQERKVGPLERADRRQEVGRQPGRFGRKHIDDGQGLQRSQGRPGSRRIGNAVAGFPPTTKRVLDVSCFDLADQSSAGPLIETARQIGSARRTWASRPVEHRKRPECRVASR